MTHTRDKHPPGTKADEVPTSERQNRDTLFATPLSQIAGFQFDASVANVFADMIQRSVPGYEATVKLLGELAGRYAQANTRCYDLGCSLGAAALSMQQHIAAQGCDIIAIDNSPAMVEGCKALPLATNATPIHWQLSNIQDADISRASVVVLNYTLQFIPLVQRDALLAKIYRGMEAGGVLIVSEKVCFDDAQHQALMTELHHNFKRANGYSELEIAQKRSAIENVLVPETLAAHKLRFKQAGFSSSDVWFQCLNFASMLAIK